MPMYQRVAILFALAFLVVSAGQSPCEAGDYRVRKKADGLVFEVSINRNPPVQGDNEIRIEIKDPQGKPVLGVEVFVNYYMPPMPRMAPMNYTVPAVPKEGEYRAVMDLIMSGPWNIVVRTRVDGKSIRVTFPIDVR
jgi:hypothetical protein